MRLHGWSRLPGESRRGDHLDHLILKLDHVVQQLRHVDLAAGSGEGESSDGAVYSGAGLQRGTGYQGSAGSLQGTFFVIWPSASSEENFGQLPRLIHSEIEVFDTEKVKDECAAYGGVIRNHSGQPILAYARSLGRTSITVFGTSEIPRKIAPAIGYTLHPLRTSRIGWIAIYEYREANFAADSFDYEGHVLQKMMEDFERNGLSSFVTVGVRDIQGEGFPENFRGTADAVFLDLPQPWLAIPSIGEMLKQDGVMCSFSPCIEQVQRSCETLRINFTGKLYAPASELLYWGLGLKCENYLDLL
ncbi:hypothetical protein GIB67_017700 [Kingdonia uniflora]|uniref:tRNA (adenine(58)-N(1))-methyltransferase n=1 Tax=Kingdonia uniflora TaxID=39325 RepID=A0A7J7NAD2_9MAGN|nr:hypothetical protein GIB67_017700 [Kingdonia uniflora]